MDSSLQLIAVGAGMLWVCLGMAKAISVSKAARQQTTYVMFLFRDMGLSARQVQEAGFQRRLHLMEALWFTVPVCIACVPYFIWIEGTRFFNDPQPSEICEVSAKTMRRCILENGKHVAALAAYEQKLIDQTTVH